MRRIELDGKVHEFPAGTTDAEIESALGGGTAPKPPSDAALTAAAAPFRGLSRVADKLTAPLVDIARLAQGEPLTNLVRHRDARGNVLGADSSEIQSPRGNPIVTQALRVAPGFAPILPVSAGLSGAGEMLAQKVEAPDKPVDRNHVLAAVLTPPVAAGVLRAMRGMDRTATRFIPSLFRSRHEAALSAADDMSGAVASPTDTNALFAAARKSDEPVPATNIVQKLAELGREMPPTPVTPNLKAAREHMTNFEGAIQQTPAGPAIGLNSLMGLRRDLGASIGRGATGETSALYGSVLRDLEAAAAAGGPGATTARAALDSYKRDLGAQKLSELVQQATATNSISGAQTPALNVSRFANLVAKNRDDLERLIGPDGMARVDKFLFDYRSLPPTHALNFATTLISGLAAGPGALVGGPAGVVAAPLAAEVLRNSYAVGPNPRGLAQLFRGTGQAARAGGAALSGDQR